MKEFKGLCVVGLLVAVTACQPQKAEETKATPKKSATSENAEAQTPSKPLPSAPAPGSPAPAPAPSSPKPNSPAPSTPAPGTAAPSTPAPAPAPAPMPGTPAPSAEKKPGDKLFSVEASQLAELRYSESHASFFFSTAWRIDFINMKLYRYMDSQESSEYVSQRPITADNLEKLTKAMAMISLEAAPADCKNLEGYTRFIEIKLKGETKFTRYSTFGTDSCVAGAKVKMKTADMQSNAFWFQMY